MLAIMLEAQVTASCSIKKNHKGHSLKIEDEKQDSTIKQDPIKMLALENCSREQAKPNLEKSQTAFILFMASLPYLPFFRMSLPLSSEIFSLKRQIF